jgi:hypothetical protein
MEGDSDNTEHGSVKAHERRGGRLGIWVGFLEEMGLDKGSSWSPESV